MSNTVIFRADANPRIGMGHVMRCLSIADAFKEAGKNPVFLLADSEASVPVRERGYEAYVLNSDFQDLGAELSEWPNLSPELIVVDSYYVTEEYLTRLKAKSRLVYIDDRASFAYPADVLVDYNAFGADIDYTSLYEKADIALPKLLLGPRYAPIRAMFKGISAREQKKTVRNILVSTGGADSLHISLMLVKDLIRRKDTDMVFHFLIGAMNTDAAEINSLSIGKENIVLHENASDMRALIESMEIAVSAAGSTQYEICACGVPLITYALADNQVPGVEGFVSRGLAVGIGDLRDNDDIPGSILEAVYKLSADYKSRVLMGKRMQRMVDGCGAERLVREILND